MDSLRGYNEILGIGTGVSATKAEADLIRAQALADLASRPARETNPLIFIIPAAGLLVLGTIFIIMRKRKR